MEKNNLLLNTQKLNELSRWGKKLFPIRNSSIVFDLILIVNHYNLINQNLTLKKIFLSLPYSENGIRKQIRHLVKFGWLDIYKSRIDGRIKLVKPSKKLIKSYKKYCDLLDSLFNK